MFLLGQTDGRSCVDASDTGFGDPSSWCDAKQVVVNDEFSHFGRSDDLRAALGPHGFVRYVKENV